MHLLARLSYYAIVIFFGLFIVYKLTVTNYDYVKGQIENRIIELNNALK